MRKMWVACARLCACAAALVASVLAPGIAQAQTGGIGTGGGVDGATTADTTYYDYWFGARDLQLGNAGEDVKTLNWVLRGLALGTPYSGNFVDQTDGAVRNFQASVGVPSDGVVRTSTRKKLSARMLTQHASWYGPGFFGNTTACGQTLTKKTVGVAHKKLPCGTRVVFAYEGRWARAKVIDRGPFIHGRTWDLTQRLAKRLGTIPAGTADVKAVVAP
jgi:peptidoglycan hydrolase-like protein with peptidoglycan-binding domain